MKTFDLLFTAKLPSSKKSNELSVIYLLPKSEIIIIGTDSGEIFFLDTFKLLFIEPKYFNKSPHKERISYINNSLNKKGIEIAYIASLDGVISIWEFDLCLINSKKKILVLQEEKFEYVDKQLAFEFKLSRRYLSKMPKKYLIDLYNIFSENGKINEKSENNDNNQLDDIPTYGNFNITTNNSRTNNKTANNIDTTNKEINVIIIPKLFSTTNFKENLINNHFILDKPINHMISSICHSKENDIYITGCYDGEIYLWSSINNTYIARISTNKYKVLNFLLNEKQENLCFTRNIGFEIELIKNKNEEEELYFMNQNQMNDNEISNNYTNIASANSNLYSNENYLGNNELNCMSKPNNSTFNSRKQSEYNQNTGSLQKMNSKNEKEVTEIVNSHKRKESNLSNVNNSLKNTENNRCSVSLNTGQNQKSSINSKSEIVVKRSSNFLICVSELGEVSVWDLSGNNQSHRINVIKSNNNENNSKSSFHKKSHQMISESLSQNQSQGQSQNTSSNNENEEDKFLNKMLIYFDILISERQYYYMNHKFDEEKLIVITDSTFIDNLLITLVSNNELRIHSITDGIFVKKLNMQGNSLRCLSYSKFYDKIFIGTNEKVVIDFELKKALSNEANTNGSYIIDSKIHESNLQFELKDKEIKSKKIVDMITKDNIDRINNLYII